jgi:hypothetical protein
MGQRVLVQKYDDLDGKIYPEDEIETIKFSLDGKAYSIDLFTDNAEEFRGVLDRYIKVAERDTKKPSAPRTKKSDPHNKRIREWAVAQGHEIADRGKLPQHIIDAYETWRDEHSGKAKTVEPTASFSGTASMSTGDE